MFQVQLQHVRPADVADILLVSAAVYCLLAVLRRSASRRLWVVAPVVAAAYVAASLLDMPLTLGLFHGALPVVLIGGIVLFQEEIRRALRRSRWPLWTGLRKRLRGESAEDETAIRAEVLSETALELAAQKVGALVVLAGHESLSPHVDGGVPLHGRLSRPLLCSLFDPHSPGHDGAVLLEDGVVTRFAVHLPLSANVEQIADRGTRHRAALGLSERSDALVVVVSEERGSVGVAENGKFESMATVHQLRSRIEQFAATRLGDGPHARPSRILPQNWRSMLLALVLACAGWLRFGYQPAIVERTYVAPIEYRNVPAHSQLDGSEPSEARVTLSGAETDFRLLDPRELTISLDVPFSPDGVSDVPITPRQVRRPSRLSVTHVAPNVARIRVEQGD